MIHIPCTRRGRCNQAKPKVKPRYTSIIIGLFKYILTLMPFNYKKILAEVKSDIMGTTLKMYAYFCLHIGHFIRLWAQDNDNTLHL